jgi:antirestriction protein
MITKPRIYVACLAAYNSGTLHGRWMDAARSSGEIHADIQDMLKHSLVPGAEEWAIHDYAGFGGLHIEEYEDLEEVAALASVIEKHGEAVAHYVNNRGRDHMDIETLEEEFEDSFVGQFDCARDFAESNIEELGFGGLSPDQLEGIWGFLDWDHVANELTITDYWCADARELGRGVYVFRRD